MTDEQVLTFQALSQKRVALVTFLQVTITAANQADLGPVVDKANLELALVNATISELLNDAPLNFPSKEELERIRTLSAVVALDAKTSNDFAMLAKRTRELIDAFPV